MHKYFMTILLLLVCTFVANGQNMELAKTLEKVAITNVNIVDVEKERIIPNKTVYIENGLIKKIDENEKVKLAENVTLVDGKNKYLIPGLADMHIHQTADGAFGTNTSPVYQDKELILYLVKGVTTVRNMAGLEEDIKIKKKINDGELLAPHYYSSGLALVTGKGRKPIKTPQEAIDEIKEEKKAGFDFVKVYCCFSKNNIEIYNKIIETCEANSIPAVGHIQVQLPLEDALKLKSIEHLEHLPWFFNSEFPDIERHEEMVKKILASGTVICPTLTPFAKGILSEEAQKDEKLLKTYKRLQELQIQYAYFLHRNKIPFILGVDSTIEGLRADFDVHFELKMLNQAGISPIEALKIGTMNVAKFLGNFDRRGSISENKESDLVLLDENPLVDISNTRKISGVMIGKKWLDKKAIEQVLSSSKN